MYTIESQGFPLTLHRIINPLADPKTLNKYPVLYGHGILFDSESMLGRSEHARPRKPVLGQPTIKFPNNMDLADDHSLPFMLSNNNFDVWLYDSRGTNNLNRKLEKSLDGRMRQKFWDFSLDEQALVDLPLFIDFVLEKTNSEKLVYVGYSESTFFLYALLSTVPEFADKIVAAVTMAPVAYVANIRGLTVPLLAPIALLTPDFFHSSFIPQPAIDAIDQVLKYLCRFEGLNHAICGSLVSGVGGYGKGENGQSFYDNFYKSTSLKSIKHFLQLFISKRFGMYDYGLSENWRRYGQAKAPSYDLRKFRSDRIIMVRGSADFLSSPEDQKRLINEMGVKPYADIVIPHYNHFDFIDGQQLIKNVNGPVITKIYELMYKDSPNSIIRTNEQNLGIRSSSSPPRFPALPPKSKLMTVDPPIDDMVSRSMGMFNNFLNAQTLMNRIVV